MSGQFDSETIIRGGGAQEFVSTLCFGIKMKKLYFFHVNFLFCNFWQLPLNLSGMQGAA